MELFSWTYGVLGFWGLGVEDLIPALTKAVEQQIQVLGEKEPEGANITRIGHLRAVVDKVKASRASKLTEVPTAQGPKVPVTHKKREGWICILKNKKDWQN